MNSKAFVCSSRHEWNSFESAYFSDDSARPTLRDLNRNGLRLFVPLMTVSASFDWYNRNTCEMPFHVTCTRCLRKIRDRNLEAESAFSWPGVIIWKWNHKRLTRFRLSRYYIHLRLGICTLLYPEVNKLHTCAIERTYKFVSLARAQVVDYPCAKREQIYLYSANITCVSLILARVAISNNRVFERYFDVVIDL